MKVEKRGSRGLFIWGERRWRRYFNFKKNYYICTQYAYKRENSPINMQVKIFKWANVIKHCEDDLIMAKAFETFKIMLSFAKWKIPSDIQNTFRTADIITCIGYDFNRIIFNVGGNKYRLICGYHFGNTQVLLTVRFLGTHDEYDRIDPCEINMF